MPTIFSAQRSEQSARIIAAVFTIWMPLATLPDGLEAMCVSKKTSGGW
jgi:hypothetical protein